LKQPFGRLIKGEPDKTMRELVMLVSRHHPSRITAIGDVVSREALKAGIPVNLSIIDQKTMRKPAATISLKDRKIYYVRNPAGVITLESWDAIKKAMKERDTVILVDGEEDLLALPCIEESPDGAIVLYGQPNEGLVAIDIEPEVRREASLIIRRMTREETDEV